MGGCEKPDEIGIVDAEQRFVAEFAGLEDGPQLARLDLRPHPLDPFGNFHGRSHPPHFEFEGGRMGEMCGRIEGFHAAMEGQRPREHKF